MTEQQQQSGGNTVPSHPQQPPTPPEMSDAPIVAAPQVQAPSAPVAVSETGQANPPLVAPPQATSSSSNAPTASSSSSSSNPRQTRQSSSQGDASSSTGLDSIDSVCTAIHSIATTGGNADMQYKLTRESLLPALLALENKGLASGVTGSMVFQSPLNGNRDPLEALMQQPNLTGNGVGFLFILLARCQAENPNPQVLVPFIVQFSQVADGNQLRLAPAKVGLLALWLAHFCQSVPAHCLQPLYDLLRKLQGDYTHRLTALHPTLLLASLRAGQYNYAEHLLSRYPVTEIDLRSFPVTYQDNLKYNLYGGTIAATLCRYELAIDLLEAAVTAPAQSGATSLLQLDAYKRLVLVQLIQNGKTSNLPKYTSSHLLQTFKQLCTTPYLDFIKHYESLSRSKCYSYVSEHRKTFENDSNYGLVTRALEAIPARAIIGLQKVYKTLEIGEVVELVFEKDQKAGGQTSNGQTTPSAAPGFENLEQAKAFVEGTVQRLVAQKKLSATITPLPTDPSKRYLEFLPISSTSSDSASSLARHLGMISNTQWTISNLDNRISSSKDFLKKAYDAVPRNLGAGGGAAGGGGMGAGGGPGGMGMNFGGNMLGEEDLMDEGGMGMIPGGWDD